MLIKIHFSTQFWANRLLLNKKLTAKCENAKCGVHVYCVFDTYEFANLVYLILIDYLDFLSWTHFRQNVDLLTYATLKFSQIVKIWSLCTKSSSNVQIMELFHQYAHDRVYRNPFRELSPRK